MAAAAAPPPLPHAPALTETRACFHGPWDMHVCRKLSDDACSVRLHGDLILSHGSRSFGPNSWAWFVGLTDPVVIKLDHRVKVFHPAVFQCLECCTEHIREALAAISGCDLAAANWVGSTCTPHDIALAVYCRVGREIDAIAACSDVDVPGYDVDIEIPQLWVSLVYTDPKELLLACKETAPETVAARVSARRRKRRREPSGELCAICLLDLETEEEEVVRLPCSHPFHTRCIDPWFHLAPTCPTCRRDIMELTFRR